MLFNAAQCVIFAMAVLENNSDKCDGKMKPWHDKVGQISPYFKEAWGGDGTVW